MIRPLIDSDLKTVVKIHLHSFPGFFLSFLGPRFLELFYRSFLEDSTGIGFVALDGDGSVIGSVVGPLVPGGYFKRLMRRRWWAFSLASVSALLYRPWIASRLLRALWYRGDVPGGDSVPRALLSSIAVAPEAQERGVGQALVKAWLFEVRRRGGQGAFLTTDAEGNEAVNQFYQRLGWKPGGSYTTAPRRRMNRYIYDFQEHS
jgi:ribosomal protein S18 acetylase RimI-like enzyme